MNACKDPEHVLPADESSVVASKDRRQCSKVAGIGRTVDIEKILLWGPDCDVEVPQPLGDDVRSSPIKKRLFGRDDNHGPVLGVDRVIDSLARLSVGNAFKERVRGPICTVRTIDNRTHGGTERAKIYLLRRIVEPPEKILGFRLLSDELLVELRQKNVPVGIARVKLLQFVTDIYIGNIRDEGSRRRHLSAHA